MRSSKTGLCRAARFPARAERSLPTQFPCAAIRAERQHRSATSIHSPPNMLPDRPADRHYHTHRRRGHRGICAFHRARFPTAGDRARRNPPDAAPHLQTTVKRSQFANIGQKILRHKADLHIIRKKRIVQNVHIRCFKAMFDRVFLDIRCDDIPVLRLDGRDDIIPIRNQVTCKRQVKIFPCTVVRFRLDDNRTFAQKIIRRTIRINCRLPECSLQNFLIRHHIAARNASTASSLVAHEVTSRIQVKPFSSDCTSKANCSESFSTSSDGKIGKIWLDGDGTSSLYPF